MNEPSTKPVAEVTERRRKPVAPPVDPEGGYWDGHAPAQDGPAESDNPS